MLPGQTDVRAFSGRREIEAVLSPYFEGVNGIDAVFDALLQFLWVPLEGVGVYLLRLKCGLHSN